MSSNPVTLVVKPRGKPIKRLPKETTITPFDSTAELYKQLAKSTGYSVHRLRVAKEDGTLVPNAKDTTVQDAGLSTSTSTITVKDLGPQIAWRTVFMVEYLGPMLIHPLIYYARPYLYPLPSLSASNLPAPTLLQKWTLILCVAHFFKRELETILVHRFSLSTMPAFNIFKNSAHYWLLAGLNIAYWTYSPSSPAQQYTSSKTATPMTIGGVEIPSDPLSLLGLALFAIGELANLNTHLVLRNLRPSGSTARGIPKGFGFGIVTCPNYMFEMLAWTGVLLVSRSFSTLVFLVVAGLQMAVWAKKKERRYRKDFGDKYQKKRFGLIPGVI